MKVIAIAVLFCAIFISCDRRLTRRIEQDEKMTMTASIYADPDLFAKNANWDGPIDMNFVYRNLFGLEENTIAVDSAGRFDLYITSPSVVWSTGINMPLLVKPGDELKASMNENGDVYFSSMTSAARSKELVSWQILMDLFNTNLWQYRSESNLRLSDDLQSSNYEQIAKARMEKFLTRSAAAIDSVLPASAATADLRKSALMYAHAKFSAAWLDYYWSNRKAVDKPSLVKQLTSLTSLAGEIRTTNDLMYYNDFLSELLAHIVSIKGSYIRVVDRDAFDTFMLSSKTYFQGITRDFLVTRTLYSALRAKIISYPEFVSTCESDISDRHYKQLCHYLGKKINSNEMIAALTAGNSFVPFDSKQELSGQELFTPFKGRLVFVDFWASWCIPCRKEMPQLRMLKRQYSDRNIGFVSISLDNSIPDWEKASKAEQLDNAANLLLKASNDTTYNFMGYTIKEIPRYMIIDQNGLVVNADAPGPKDPALRSLLEKYLKGF
ncbi:TlpA family protein disulfide reductase [Terrimonas sp. NA20]|uniref:TlpA family protein disulfide reductase n=1 Tax=Terrimonas ginsenosidimutans TaxID=2908004 RepID=A0ABS9KK60_9BACT|nr:TlpA disulfide reductase family protein [Terrimonas ginsenosidimutans]MCG2612710.1 TlpA family protein disulfide reductase [Terrimonas ginsenosidimutans]